MRFAVLGAGAIGGVVGGRLAEHGHETVLIARGQQYAAIRERGLQVESPDAVAAIDVPVVDHPARIKWTADDVVLLTVKTQDTVSALCDLAAVAPADAPIVCMQNGVESERLAARWFARVYGVCVMCPTTYLIPGVVQAWSSPTTGILDIGRYPAGVDAATAAIAAALRTSTFTPRRRHDIMRWKYGKLVMNLGNAVEAICGPPARHGPIGATWRGAKASRASLRPGLTTSRKKRTQLAAVLSCNWGRSRGRRGKADRPGRACSDERTASRLTTSTEKSCFSGGSTASRRRSTGSCSASRTRWRARVHRRERCRPKIS